MLLGFIADGMLIVILLVSAPIIAWELRQQFWLKSPVVIMAGLTSLVVGKIMSILYQPAVARPFLELGTSPGAAYIDNPGFPSDHALLATVAVVAVYALTRNKKLAVFLGFLVIVMCVGRVIALVHTPLDVVAGIVAGLTGAYWYKKLTN